MNRPDYAELGAARVRRRLANHTTAPTLDPAALHGLAGEVVTALAPLTEASPAAMLVTVLVAFAAMVGRTAYVPVGAARHYPILFAVVHGNTARARKGTSKAAVMPVLLAAGPDAAAFLNDRVLTGIGSGETVIQAAASGGADPIPGAVSEPDDDQRLWVIEEEYARLLTVAARTNSTLSAILRQAWDGGVLENRTKHARLRAEHAHVCVLGHVTRADLAASLTSTDLANGSANRFLYVYSERTTLHPTPGRLTADQVDAFGERLMKAIDTARHTGEVTRTAEFDQAWDGLYREIESQVGGGATYEQLTARSAPHILRLALVYALLDGAARIDLPHLHAAAALWEYCEATVAHVWGMTTGSARADKLLTALRDAGTIGLTRKQIGELFSNNLDAAAIDELSDALVTRGLATPSTRATGGRPSQVLTSTDCTDRT